MHILLIMFFAFARSHDRGDLHDMQDKFLGSTDGGGFAFDFELDP
jgi:hypothetical protein